MRELYSCVNEKFNGFNIVRVEFIQKLRQTFRHVHIIYKPVKKCNNIVNCFFSGKLNMVIRALYSEGKRIKHSTAWQYYFRLNYYAQKDKFDCLAYINFETTVPTTQCLDPNRKMLLFLTSSFLHFTQICILNA